jgi:hypothetical protein
MINLTTGKLPESVIWNSGRPIPSISNDLIVGYIALNSYKISGCVVTKILKN